MLTETLNDCVILPHLCNWANPVRLKRSWATSIASGIDGAEDRAAGRTTPTRKLTYTVLADGIQERAILTERLKAALKSGRAVCPLFGRAQGCRPAGADLEITWGRWPWATGDYAFLCLPSKTQMNGVNYTALVDVGGAGSGTWEAETNYWASGGSTRTTASAIDVTHLGDTTPPPQSVLQCARYVDASSGPAEGIRFRVSVPGPRRCKVRLWFAFFDDAVSPAAVYRVIEAGSQSATEINPWTACGSALLQAGFCDVAVSPGADNVLDFTVYLKTGAWLQVNALEVYSTCWQLLEIANAQQLDALTLSFDPADVHFPDFADIPQIYPVLFGKPSVGDLEALTNWHGQVEISVEEPLGEAASARSGVCQIELCGLPTEPGTIPTTEPTPGATQVETATNGFLIAWATAPADLTQDQKDANVAWLEANKREFLIDHPGTTFGEAYWQHRDTQESQWSAERYYQDGGELQQRIPTQFWGCWVLTCDATLP